MRHLKPIFMVLILATFAFAQIAPPENLTATGVNNNKSVKLTWEHAQTVGVKYFVYKKDAPADDTTKQFRKIAHVFRKDFTDFHLMAGVTYSYFVTASVGTNQSEPSNIVEFTSTVPVYTYGKINGFVFDETTSLPIYNAMVKILPGYNTTGSLMMTVKTDSNGFFSARVKTADYKIFTSTRAYIGEYYDNATSFNLAAIITVAENDSLTLNPINLSAIVPPVVYTLSGTVTDGVNPKLARITAFVKNRLHVPHHGFGHYSTKTDSLGNFSLNVRLGDTIALFAQPFDMSFKSEFWDGKATIDLADLVVVSDNIIGIDFTLDPKPVYNNGVAGNVYDSAGTLGLKGHVYLMKKDITAPNPHNLRRKIWAITDSLTGAYSFSNLEPGEYIAIAAAYGYKASYFTYSGNQTMDWRLADSIVVSDEGTVSDINFYLNARIAPNTGTGLALFGNTSELTGTVVEGVFTFVSDAEGNIVSASVSDPAGTYAHEGLIDGYYMLTANTINFGEVNVSAIDINGEIGDVELDIELTPDGTTSADDNTVLPDAYELFQNYPNPFNPSTIIEFALPEASLVSLRVYNIIGQEIKTLISNEFRDAGIHQVTFDASKLANGVYLYRIETAGVTITKKMTLMK
jgi:hypothetical protein